MLFSPHRSVTDQIDYLLTADDVVYRAAPASEDDVIGLGVSDLHDAGDAISVSVTYATERALEVLAIDERGDPAAWARVRYSGDSDHEGRPVGRATLDGVGPGCYTIVARAPQDPHGIALSPVHSTTLVL